MVGLKERKKERRKEVGMNGKDEDECRTLTNGSASGSQHGLSQGQRKKGRVTETESVRKQSCGTRREGSMMVSHCADLASSLSLSLSFCAVPIMEGWTLPPLSLSLSLDRPSSWEPDAVR